MPARGHGAIVRVTRIELRQGAIERAKALLRRAPQRVSRHRATVGLHEDEGGRAKVNYEGDVATERTLAEVMRFHEFGTDTAPERSFLRGWFDANADRLADGMKRAMRAEFNGDKGAVRSWVAGVVEEWRAYIADGGDFAGLAESTVARKRAAGLPEPETPLRATEQFLQAWRGRLDGSDV